MSETATGGKLMPSYGRINPNATAPRLFDEEIEKNITKCIAEAVAEERLEGDKRCLAQRADAMLEEREACAKVADRYHDNPSLATFSGPSWDIATKIRARSSDG